MSKKPFIQNKKALFATAIICTVFLSGCALWSLFSPRVTDGDTDIIKLLRDPFFTNCYSCGLNDMPGNKAGKQEWSCCENVCYTTRDTDIIFSFERASDKSNLSVQVIGVLQAELGLTASNTLTVSASETQRWMAIHCYRTGHCEQHLSATNWGNCDSSMVLKEKRAYAAYISGSNKLDFAAKTKLSLLAHGIGASADFQTTDSNFSFRVKNYYLCKNGVHEPCGHTESYIDKNRWTLYAKSDSCKSN